MSKGNKVKELLGTLTQPEIEVIEWHFKNGTSMAWMHTALLPYQYIGKTTLKEYRAKGVYGVPSWNTGSLVNEDAYSNLLAKKRQLEDIAAKAVAPRVLTLDIERVPGVFTGQFWDMNSYKGRRISPDDVTSWPRTICFAWKWLEDAETDFSATWLVGDDELIRTAWRLFDEADIVVGHNMARFDLKKLRTEWAAIGLHDPSTFKVVDTLSVAKANFSLESNMLSALCEYFGVQTKTDRYSVAVALAAVGGDEEAQKRIEEYNRGDIVASESLYLYFRDHGYIPNHPVMAPGHALRCPSCGSRDVEPMAKPYVAQVMAYPVYRCQQCGTQSRGRVGERITDLRGVRS